MSELVMASIEDGSEPVPSGSATLGDISPQTWESIRNTLASYANGVDLIDFDLLANVFTEDAEFVGHRGGEQIDRASGRNDIADFFVRLRMSNDFAVRHLITNVTVEAAAEDHLVVHALFLAEKLGVTGTSPHGSGSYRIRMVEDQVGVWRMSDLSIYIDEKAQS